MHIRNYPDGTEVSRNTVDYSAGRESYYTKFSSKYSGFEEVILPTGELGELGI